MFDRLILTLQDKLDIHEIGRVDVLVDFFCKSYPTFENLISKLKTAIDPEKVPSDEFLETLISEIMQA